MDARTRASVSGLGKAGAALVCLLVVLVAAIAAGESGDAQARTRRRLMPSGMRDFSGAGKPELKVIQHEGAEREYFLYVPKSATKPAPLVLLFHGGGGQARGTDKAVGGLAALADEKGFVVAYPNGMDRHWNDGRPDLSEKYYDDVGFISKLIDSLVADKIADPTRVYATGISNGGFFSQYLALKCPNKLAAVAPVVATVPTQWRDLTGPPVPVLMLLGTADPLVPWQGGQVGGKLLRKKRGQVASGRDALKFWLAHNKNTATPVKQEIANKDRGDGCRAFSEQYGSDDSPSEVLFYEIQGGGHTWPDGEQYLPRAIVGPVCRDFDANRVIWEFFSRHRSGL